MIKMLYLHFLQADSTENWNAFCKLIVLDNYKISKKSKNSVLRYIENITGSVGNFVKCRYRSIFSPNPVYLPTCRPADPPITLLIYRQIDRSAVKYRY